VRDRNPLVSTSSSPDVRKGRGVGLRGLAVRPIVGPWGQIDVVVEQSSDGQFYAVLKQPTTALLGVVGTTAPDEEEAVALLRLECLRAYGGP
jgi:hypothetical protein